MVNADACSLVYVLVSPNSHCICAVTLSSHSSRCVSPVPIWLHTSSYIRPHGPVLLTQQSLPQCKDCSG